MPKHSKPLSVLALLAVLLAALPARAADEVPDWTTTLKVKIELLTKLGVDALRIDVDTLDGQVSLAGAVAKRETAELAEDVAKSVEGVQKVDNRLTVKPSEDEAAGASKSERALDETKAEVADGILESKVRLALIDRLGRDGFRIGTEAANGVVTLELPADLSAARREEAEAAVGKVSGVTEVVTVDKR